MNTVANCPQCGAALADGLLQGLCPRCLARQAASLLAARANTDLPPINAPPSACIRYFGDYELLEEIARGGMGVVFKARQVSLNRVVAVKLLPSGPFASDEFVKRFRAEAEAAASLQHPNIVAIHEVGEHEGQQYFSMDFVDGQSLAQRARETPLPLELAADYMRTIAEAIHYAHQRGILHRDLKPSNVLIDSLDRPRVTDFGLAKRLTGSEPGSRNPELTLTGQVLGTPNYMSPEQASGRRGEVTVASDLYSLGAILHFLLTGWPPFQADSLEGVLEQVLHREPTPPRSVRPAVPQDLETICLKCLAKEPAQRYATAQELADDLGRFQRGEPIQARPVRVPERIWRWCRRKPALATLILAVHLVGALGLAGILWQWSQARHSAAVARLAQRETTTNLWNSLLAQARANRLSGRPGRRFDSLDTLARAAAIRRTPEMRDEAIAALALSDFRLLRRTASSALAHIHFNASLDRYATALPHGGVSVRSTADDRELVSLPTTGPKVAAIVRFSADDRLLAIRYEDSRLKVWTVDSARKVFEGRCAQDWGGSGADFSPDGRHIALAQGRREVIVHDLTTGEVLARHRTPMPAVCVRYSFDGQLLAVMTRGERTVAVLDAASGERLASLALNAQPYHFAWQPDGERLAIATSDRRVHLWDARNGREERALTRHYEDLMCAEFVAGTSLIASVGFDGLRLWDWRTGAMVLSSLEFGKVQVSSRGDRMARVDWGSRDFALYELAAGSPVCHPGAEEADPDTTRHNIQAAAFSPDGRWLAYAAGGMLQLFDGLRELASLEAGPATWLFFDTRSNLWVAGQRGCFQWRLRASGDLRQWSLGPPSRLGPAEPVRLAAASRDGRVALICQGRSRRVMDMATGQLMSTLSDDAERTASAAVSPDGETIVTCAWYAPSFEIWNARDGTLRTNLAPPQWNGGVNAADLVFSPNGRWLLASSLQPDTCLWDTRDWTRRWSWPRNDLPLAAFAPNGSLAAAREAKRFVRLLNPETGETVATLESASMDHVGRMVFSPDGTRLAVCGMSKPGLTLWDLRALRRDLTKVGLDWDLPPLADPEPAPPAPLSLRFLSNLPHEAAKDTLR